MLRKDLEFFGKNMVGFLGVVEDVQDPLKIGRVRVRCIGWHTDYREILPTEDLPWAMVLQPCTSAAVGDVGRSPTGILNGSWIFGFFLDGEDAQQPLVLGTVAGIPSSSGKDRKKYGFSDPTGTYPQEDRVDKPDVNRLARNDPNDPHPSVQTRSDSRRSGIPVALKSTETFEEPEDPRSPEYPKNHVRETESGHVFEADDTPSSERIHEMHRTGTYREVRPDGSTARKTANNDHFFVGGDSFESVVGNKIVTIEGDLRIRVEGDLEIEVVGDVRQRSGGDRETVVDGVERRYVLKNQEITVGDENNPPEYGGNQKTLIWANTYTKIVKTDHKQAASSSSTVIRPQDWPAWHELDDAVEDITDK